MPLDRFVVYACEEKYNSGDKRNHIWVKLEIILAHKYYKSLYLLLIDFKSDDYSKI